MNFPKPAVGMLLERPPRLFRDHQTQAAEVAEGARMVVWTITNVEEWDPTQTDAAHGAHASGRWLADARHSELVLA